MSVKSDKKEYLIKCLVFSLAMATLSFLYFIIKGGGILTIVEDYNLQQLTYNPVAADMLKSRPFGEWCWNLDLGTSFITGFGFSLLGSPFFWISLLFPQDLYLYLAGGLYILKYTVAAVFAYLYLCLFLTDKRYALLGGLLYAFSGFQSINLMFYNFHDVVAFFPLLLLGLEKAMDNSSKYPYFILAVFINCLINYYFFVGEVIFLILYFLFRFCGRPVKDLARDTLRCMLCGILGVCMAMLLFLPNIIISLSDSRRTQVLPFSDIIPDTQRLLYILKGLLLPADIMMDQSAGINQEWGSCCAWLPFVGLTLSIAYIIQRRDRLAAFVLTLLVISLSPLMASAFSMFMLKYYRWWYMPSLMMSLASARVMESPKDFKIEKAAFINIALILSLFAALYFVKDPSTGESLIYHRNRFILLTLIGLAGCAGLIALCKVKRFEYKALLLCIACFSVFSTAMTLRWYRQGVDAEDFLERYELGSKLKTLDPLYRYNSTDNEITLTGNGSGIGSFSSSIEASGREYDLLMGAYGENRNSFRYQNQMYAKLLGGKFNFSTELEGNEEVLDEITVNSKTYYISSQGACPIGFTVNSYITAKELEEIDWDKRALALMHTAPLHPEDEAEALLYVPKADPSMLNLSAEPDFHTDDAVKRAVSDFKRDSRGFSCAVEREDKTLLFFSVPYGKGWKARLDGEAVDIINACGMMLLPLDEGFHEVVFEYSTPGLKAGLVISSISFLIFAVYFISTKKRSLANE